MQDGMGNTLMHALITVDVPEDEPYEIMYDITYDYMYALIETLIDGGADLTITNRRGLTAFNEWDLWRELHAPNVSLHNETLKNIVNDITTRLNTIYSNAAKYIAEEKNGLNKLKIMWVKLCNELKFRKKAELRGLAKAMKINIKDNQGKLRKKDDLCSEIGSKIILYEKSNVPILN